MFCAQIVALSINRVNRIVDSAIDERACGRPFVLPQASVDGPLPPLDDRDLGVCQPVQLIHQRIDLPVGGFDLALENCFGVRHLLRRQLLVQVEHTRHQVDHAVVAGSIGGGGEVDGAANSSKSMRILSGRRALQA